MSRARDLADSADLNFDDGTLVIDSGNNRVGIGTTSPAEKLDVRGTIQVGVDGTTAGEIRFMDSGSVTEEATISSDADGGLIFSGNSGPGKLIFRTGSSTERMRIDSSGNVGIGTSSPASTLSVATADSDMATFNGTGAQGGYIAFERSGSAKGYIGSSAQLVGGGSNNDFTVRATNNLTFAIGAAEAMRIDSSGNLLVGTTDATLYDNVTGAGVNVTNNGRIFVATSSDSSMILNRQSSDGDIALFRKDGSTIGSIGVADSGDRIYLAGGGLEGVGIDNGANSFVPTSETGAFKDGHLSLGRADARFTNLYLSGGVYLGGTGAANKLDDYEEGTFSPTVRNGSGGSMGAGNTQAVYRKMGSFVYVSFFITGITKSGSGTLGITGLPFAIAATNDSADTTGEVRWDNVNTDTQMLPYFKAGTSDIDFQQFNSTGYNGSVTIADASASFDLYNITGMYITSD